MENQNNNLSNAHKWSKSYAPKGEKRGKYIKKPHIIKWYIKKYWYKYLLITLLTLGIIYCDVEKPVIIGQAVDLIGLGEITVESLLAIIITIAVIVIMKFIVSVSRGILLGNLFHRLYYHIKIQFMQNILCQDAEFFTEYHPGDLMTRATSDTFSMANLSTHLIFGLITLILTIVMSAVSMIKYNLLLTIFSIIPLPLIFIVVVTMRPKISANWRLVRTKNSTMSNLAMESVQHVKLIRAFVNEKQDYERLTKSAADCYNTEKKSVLMQSTFGPTFRFCTNISQLVAYGYGAYLIINQQMTVGDLISFSLLLAQFSGPMMQLGNQVAQFAQSAICVERVMEVLNAKPEIIDKDDAKDLEKFETIEFKDYHFTYPGDDIEILKGIDLTIKTGKSVGIVGKTGSGKSTLVKQLLRRYPINDTNKMLINEEPIDYYTKESIRKMVAYVPQEHELFARSIEDNILMGKGEDSNIDLNYAIKMADFEKDLDFIENGLSTIVGEYGVTLSGGQKQRLSIARALIKDAPILILDDSLSAVDGTTEANIIANLKEIRNQKTNIIVAHRLTAVEACDEIIVLSDGKISERGTHNELMAKKGWYYEQYVIQEMGASEDEK